MYCVECGAELEPQAPAYCPHCGRPTTGAQHLDSATVSQEVARTIEVNRSFLLHAVLVLLLYNLFWPVGIVMNLVFLRQAQRIEMLHGVSPEGKGCLEALLFFFFVVAALLVLAIVAFFLLESTFAPTISPSHST